MFFEMNYDTGHWWRLKRTRVVSKHGSSGPMQKSWSQHTQHYVSQYIHLVGMLFEMNCDSGFNDLNLVSKHDASGPMQKSWLQHA